MLLNASEAAAFESSSNNVKRPSPLRTSAAIRNWESLPERLKAGCV
jgi:hypothetical protein